MSRPVEDRLGGEVLGTMPEPRCKLTERDPQSRADERSAMGEPCRSAGYEPARLLQQKDFRRRCRIRDHQRQGQPAAGNDCPFEKSQLVIRLIPELRYRKAIAEERP